MSFYGSVYYQLVDTFYKVITRNANLTGSTFPEELSTDKQELQALGRKGVLQLINGNKWINFTFDNDKNNFVVWHGKPDNSVTTTISGYKNLGTTKPDSKDITELRAGDYFSTFTSKYDEAGHLVPESMTTQYFKLPKSEVQDDVDKLLELVGEPYKEEVRDENGNVTSVAEESTGLFAITDAQEDEIVANEKRITALEDIYGTDVFETARTFFPGGSLDLSEWDASGGKYQYKNFATAFGSIDKIRETCFGDSQSSQTVSEAFGVLRSLISNLETSNGNINDLIAYLSEDVKELQDKDKSLDGEINALEEKDTSLSNRIDNLTSTVTSNNETVNAQIIDLTAVVNSNKKACDSNIATLQTEDAAIRTAFANEDTKIRTDFANADLTLKSDISAAYSTADEALEENITKAYSDADSVLKKEVTEAYTAADSALKEEIAENYTKADSELKTEIQQLYAEADTALQSQIKSAYEAADAALTTAYAAADTTLKSELSEQISALSTKIGTSEETTSLYDLIAAMQEKINALEARVAALEAPSEDDSASEDTTPTE